VISRRPVSTPHASPFTGHDDTVAAQPRRLNTKLEVYRKTMDGYVGVDTQGHECIHVKKLDSSSIPIIDLKGWIDGDQESQAAIQVAVEDCLKEVGFILIVGHGLSPELIASTQRAFQEFFSLQQEGTMNTMSGFLCEAAHLSFSVLLESSVFLFSCVIHISSDPRETPKPKHFPHIRCQPLTLLDPTLLDKSIMFLHHRVSLVKMHPTNFTLNLPLKYLCELTETFLS
jgi:hypothetical protein